MFYQFHSAFVAQSVQAASGGVSTQVGATLVCPACGKSEVIRSAWYAAPQSVIGVGYTRPASDAGLFDLLRKRACHGCGRVSVLIADDARRLRTDVNIYQQELELPERVVSRLSSVPNSTPKAFECGAQIVVGIDLARGALGKVPVAHATASMGCPICAVSHDQVAQTRLSGLRWQSWVPTDQELRGLTWRLSVHLAKVHACNTCGILLGLSERQERKVRNKLASVLTDDLITERLLELQELERRLVRRERERIHRECEPECEHSEMACRTALHHNPFLDFRLRQAQR